MEIDYRTTLDDCPFCAAYCEEGEALPWYDTPLFRRDGTAVAIAAVGSLVPGYVLAAPARHAPSVRRLPSPDKVTFLQFVTEVRRRVEDCLGPATLFEHGSCEEACRRRSACLVHSHVHIVPGHYSFTALELPVDCYPTLAEAVHTAPGDSAEGYLLYQEPGGAVCLASDPGVSQFFRRRIAHVLGRPQEWDYAVCPGWENLRKTHEGLQSEPCGTPRSSPPTLASSA
ncbi:hypothetical protein [Cryptosporangium minutisporangium]|uniref:HIT domain-containing protein n=1 Tax=Cryptosporangium minutisporangium TaxID=113569 RepID=A0ABP6T9L7_9ACTN